MAQQQPLQKLLELQDRPGERAYQAAAMKDSMGKIQDGTESVNASGHVLGEIVGSVKQVREIVAHIAAASREQAAGIYRLNQVMSQMQSMTLQNSSLVEEAANAGAPRRVSYAQGVNHYARHPYSGG